MKVGIRRQVGEKVFDVQDEIKNIDDLQMVSQMMEAALDIMSRSAVAERTTAAVQQNQRFISNTIEDITEKQLALFEKLLKDRPTDVKAALDKMGITDYQTITKKQASQLLDSIIGDRRGPRKGGWKRR